MTMLRIGTAVAERGTNARGAIEVARRHDGSPVLIPIILVNGRHDGPTLAVHAGIHGSEYPGIEAVWHLVRSLDPAELAGRLIAVPVANVPAFMVDQRCNDIDHQDLNRVFPGAPRGTLTERIAHHLVHDVVARADYMIDLHASGDGEIVRVAMAYTGYETMTLELAKASGFPFVWMADRPEISALGPVAFAALARGIPTTLLEAGSGREYRQEDGRALYDAVVSIMRYLQMIGGKPNTPMHRVIFKCDVWARVGVGGFFRPAAAVGQRMRKGELIASVHDIYDREMERFEAPSDGLICLLNKKRSVRIGEHSHVFGEILDEERLE